jgi:uncharacterized protein (TIGR02246 family)
MTRPNLIPTLVLAFGLTGACAPAAPPPPDTAAMLASATALDEQFAAAYNAYDAEAVAALYWNSPETVSFPPDVMVVRGFDAIRSGTVEGMAAMQAAGAKLELTETHHMVIGDAVATWGMWKLTMTGPDGAPMEMAGRFSDIKAERDGKWVYVMDHASAPLPPPAGS